MESVVEETCPICYNSFEELSYVMFDKCGHRFCSTCSIELIIHRKVCCPVDRMECSNVVLKLTRGEKVHKTVSEYQEDLVNNAETMKYHMEKSFSIYISVYLKAMKIFLTLKIRSREFVENWIDRGLGIQSNEIREFKNLLYEKSEFINELYQEIKLDVEKSNFILSILRRYPQKTLPSFLLKLRSDNVMLLNISTTFCNEMTKENILKLSGHEYLLKRRLEYIQCDITSLQSMTKYLTKLIISEVKDNKDLYSVHYPALCETYENQCLVCTESIKDRNYAIFPQCCHKICLRCVKDLGMTERNCPIDGKELENLVMFDNNNFGNSNDQTCLVFLNENRQEISNIHNMFSKLLKLLSETLDLKIFIPIFEDLIYQIFMKQNAMEKEKLINSLQNELKIFKKEKYVSHFIILKTDICFYKIVSLFPQIEQRHNCKLLYKMKYLLDVSMRYFCEFHNLFFTLNYDSYIEMENVIERIVDFKFVHGKLSMEFVRFIRDCEYNMDRDGFEPFKPVLETIKQFCINLFKGTFIN